MNLVEFSELIVKKIVKDPDMVKVQQFDSDDETVIEIVVAEEDMGRVIGKNGKSANAIRTLVQASSSLSDNKYVKIDIDKFSGRIDSRQNHIPNLLHQNRLAASPQSCRNFDNIETDKRPNLF